MQTGHAIALANQVAAVCAELSEAMRWAREGKPGASAMVRSLKKDLTILESRLADIK